MGQVSGDLIPRMDVQGIGYAAISSSSFTFGGSGRLIVSQLYPIIDSVNQSFAVSSRGNSIIKLRGRGLIPLLSSDLDLTVLSAENAVAVYKNSSLVDGIHATFASEKVFDIKVGGQPCRPLEFSWIEGGQQISCILDPINDSTGIVGASRGISRNTYTNTTLTSQQILDADDFVNATIFDGFSAFNTQMILWGSNDFGEFTVTLAHKFSVVYIVPVTGTWSFYLSRFGKASSTLELYMLANQKRSFVAALKSQQKGVWTSPFKLTKGDQILFQILDIKNGNGKPSLSAKVFSSPAINLSEARGGCKGCGIYWTWDADDALTTQVDTQNITYSSNSTSYLATVQFSLPSNKLNWSRADARLYWGKSENYILLNPYSDPAKVEADFYSTIASASCLWKSTPSRRFYEYDTFESIQQSWFGAG